LKFYDSYFGIKTEEGMKMNLIFTSPIRSFLPWSVEKLIVWGMM